MNKRPLLLVSLLLILCVIRAISYIRNTSREDQLAFSKSETPYAKIISNSSGIKSKEYPLHHFLSDGSIARIKFLEPQELKDNTQTAIIVLGDRPLDDTTPTVDMVYRVLKGVELAKKFPKAIMIMSGGKTKGPTSEAQMMGLIAWGRGVDPLRIILEDNSQTTAENAKNTASIIGSKNIQQVFMITEPTRLQEAIAIFQKHDKEFKNIQGVESDVTRPLIIGQMENYLLNHDDRVVRGRLHYVEKGEKYKAFNSVVLPEE